MAEQRERETAEVLPELSVTPATAILPDEALGDAWRACFQCQKCAAGCPLQDALDLRPNQVIRLLQFGRLDEVLGSHTIWLCLSCSACTVRCPNGVDLARLMDHLRTLSRTRGCPAAEPDVERFHEAFLESVRHHGRSHELELIRRYKLKSGSWFEHLALGLRMFRKGKIRLLGRNIRARRAFRELLDRCFPRRGPRDGAP